MSFVSVHRTSDRHALVEPLIRANPLSRTSQGTLQKREPMVIEGLLQIRQSCPTGYALCSDDTNCCPLGGSCCTGSKAPGIAYHSLKD